MATNIHDFKQSFKGGVRPNLFRVSIAHQVGIPQIELLCKAAQIPATAQIKINCKITSISTNKFKICFI